MNPEDQNRFKKSNQDEREETPSVRSFYTFRNPITKKISTVEIPFSQNVSQLLESIVQIRGGKDFQDFALNSSGPMRDLHLIWPVPSGPNLATMTRNQLLEKIVFAKAKIASARGQLSTEDNEAIKLLDEILLNLNQILLELEIK